MSWKLNLRTKLLLQFLLIGQVPLIFMALTSYNIASHSLLTAKQHQLEGQGQLRAKGVENYLNQIKNQIITFSEDRMIVDAAVEFRSAFKGYLDERGVVEADIPVMRQQVANYYRNDFKAEFARQNDNADPAVEQRIRQLDDFGVVLQHDYIAQNENPLGNKHRLDTADNVTRYGRLHGEIHPVVRDFLEKFRYYDIFIVDPDTGHIVYSVFKELDFATSLTTGAYAQTNFGEVFRQAAESNDPHSVHFVDYATYWPSYESPASFIASPIFSGEEKVGVLIFQMPLDVINETVATTVGMGETGDSYLIGADQKLRTSTRTPGYDSAASFKKNLTIENGIISRTLAGENGYAMTSNYQGTAVLTAFHPVDVFGKKWALIAEKAESEVFAPVRNLGIWIAAINILTSLVILMLGFWIGRGIANPLLNIAQELNANSEEVKSESETMNTSSQQLSEMATEQASSIEETAASIEQINAMVANNVEQAEHSSKLSRTVQETAVVGNESMKKLVSSKQEITKSNEQIQHLVQVIGEIGDKTNIIDEIVFQTKLLSFNASVEAERAGEHGRGFAVVAQEVGNLAQMSGKAALEIAAMVKDSIKAAEGITMDNKEKVDAGNHLVRETASILEQIGANAAKLNEQAEQIYTSSREQAEGITQINTAMNQLDQATQHNSSNAEKTATVSRHLLDQSESLQASVNKLLLLVNGVVDGAKLEPASGKMNQTSKTASGGHSRQVTNVVNIRSVAKKDGKERYQHSNPLPKAAISTGLNRVGQNKVASTDADENWESL